nr:AlkA N-terminal domain-containing protein [Galbitalea soli]
MRLIEDGVVERDGVTGLAKRLGYTPRHLTRVLVAELGAGPLALARARRAQTARTLLVATSLSIAEVAFAAGFSSIRQFNDTVLAVYETTPTALRARFGRRQPDRTVPGEAISLSLRLPARAPFDGAGLLAFFADHAVEGLETASSGVFERRMRLPGGPATVSLALDGATAVLCTARLSTVADVGTLVARVRRLFDLDADSVAIDAVLAADPALAPLVASRPGIRIPGSLDAEETLFRTLLGQQVSVAAARSTIARLCRELGDDGAFPSAAALAEHGATVLRGPAARVASIVTVAEAIADDRLRLDLGTPVPEFLDALTRYPGIGPWTAGYLAMRVLGSPDILVPGDLVVQRNAAALGLASRPRELERLSVRWAPWRSYATLHLWRRATPS